MVVACKGARPRPAFANADNNAYTNTNAVIGRYANTNTNTVLG